MPEIDVAGIAALGVPVLFLDTCTVLDLMRDPTRETVRGNEREAALDLLAAVEGGQELVAFIAAQVVHELAEHAPRVQDEAAQAIERLKKQVARIEATAAVYDSAGSASLVHLDDHAERARAIVDRWMKAAMVAGQGP